MLDNFLLSMNTVLPLFAVLLAGYLLKKPLGLDEAYLTKSNRLCFKIFLPLLLFSNIYSSQFDLRAQGRAIAFSVCGILAVFLLSCFIAFLAVRDPKKRGAMAQGMFRSNYVILGLPMVSNLCGSGSLETASILLAFAVPMFNILSVLALELFCGKSRSLLDVLKNIAKNPLVLSVILALAVYAASITLPKPVLTSVGYLANIATGFMLFVMGASLRPSAIRGNLKYLSVAVAVRLVVGPAVMLAAAYLLGFRGTIFATLLILFATPTALSSYPMAQQMGADSDLASEIVVFTTAVSLITLFFWIFLFLQLGAY